METRETNIKKELKNLEEELKTRLNIEPVVKMMEELTDLAMECGMMMIKEEEKMQKFKEDISELNILINTIRKAQKLSNIKI